MKTHHATYAAALMFWGALALNSSAQFTGPTPVGTWDCLLSGGGQQGIAFVNFTDDGSFTGYQILTSKVKNDPDDFEGRNPGGGEGRYPTTSNRSGTNLFGFGELSGPWSYDDQGHVIGSFTEVLAEGSDEGTSTNSISFQGKVVPGKRITLTCSTPNGKVTYKGVPATPLPDLSGSWYGTKGQNDQSFLEFFTLTRPDSSENLYLVEGSGPAYTTYGVCMRSAQRKIAFAIMEGVGTNTTLRATYGSFGTSSKTTKAKTKGIGEPEDNVKFDAVLEPAVQ